MKCLVEDLPQTFDVRSDSAVGCGQDVGYASSSTSSISGDVAGPSATWQLPSACPMGSGRCDVARCCAVVHGNSSQLRKRLAWFVAGQAVKRPPLGESPTYRAPASTGRSTLAGSARTFSPISSFLACRASLGEGLCGSATGDTFPRLVSVKLREAWRARNRTLRPNALPSMLQSCR